MRTALALTTLALLARPVAAGEWQTFSSQEGCFTILLPATPLEKATANGCQLEVASSGWFFRVLYLDYGKAPSPVDAEKCLDETVAKTLPQTNAELLTKKKVSLGEHSGREILVKFDGISHLRMRAFMVSNRLYMVLLSGPREQVTSAEADRFFDSFQLTGPVPLKSPATAVPAFQPFACKEGGFTVLLPGTPKEEPRVMQTAAGTWVKHQFSVQAGNLVWYAGYEDLPVAPRDPKDIVSHGARAAAGERGKVLTEKELPGKEPGHEVLIRTAESVELRVRCYLAGRRLYQLIVGGPANEVTSPDVDRFFASFRLTK
jgi:hypothetical protein